MPFNYLLNRDREFGTGFQAGVSFSLSLDINSLLPVSSLRARYIHTQTDLSLHPYGMMHK